MNSSTSGENIRQLRLFKNYKQSAMAKKLGISQQAYSKLEKTKNIEPYKTEQLLTALSSSVEDLEKIKSLYPPPEI